MSNNGLDAFEQKLRDSLDQFEVPYNSSDWVQMERALNGGYKGWWLSGLGLSMIAAGTLLVGGGMWYMASGKDADSVGPVAEATTAAPLTEQSAPGLLMNDGSTADAAILPTTEATSNIPDVAPMQEASTPVEENSLVSGAAQGNRSAAATSLADMEPKGSTTATKPEKEAVKTTANPDRNTFTASVSEGCAGTSVEFKVSHMPEDGIYLWNFGDGSFSNKANPEHTFTKPGSYQVMLSMSAAGVGTIENKPSSDMIVIHDTPKAAFNVLKQEYDGHLPSVHFENRSLAGKKYRWDFGDGQTSTIPHPDHIYKKKGVYQVELTVTNEIGCEDKVMKDVRIDKDYNLDAPTSFSPNGDGSDETFMPEALRTLGVKFNLTVYSPNGTLLYQTNDATKPWTGRPNNRGDICGPGEYVWVVDVRESLHLAETYTGKVKLVK